MLRPLAWILRRMEVRQGKLSPSPVGRRLATEFVGVTDYIFTDGDLH